MRRWVAEAGSEWIPAGSLVDNGTVSDLAVGHEARPEWRRENSTEGKRSDRQLMIFPTRRWFQSREYGVTRELALGGLFLGLPMSLY